LDFLLCYETRSPGTSGAFFNSASPHVSGTPGSWVRFFPMSSDRAIVDAVNVAQNLLRQNLPPRHNLSDAAIVLRFRELIGSPAIRSALERGSDTLPAFALRAVERVLCDHSRPHRETLNLLWDVLDDPHLNRALGSPTQSAFRGLLPPRYDAPPSLCGGPLSRAAPFRAGHSLAEVSSVAEPRAVGAARR